MIPATSPARKSDNVELRERNLLYEYVTGTSINGSRILEKTIERSASTTLQRNDGHELELEADQPTRATRLAQPSSRSERPDQHRGGESF